MKIRIHRESLIRQARYYEELSDYETTRQCHIWATEPDCLFDVPMSNDEGGEGVNGDDKNDV